MERDSLISEAKARITWGDSPSEVRCFLTSKGMPPAEADEQIRQLAWKRNQEVRRSGIGNILVGTLLMLPGLFALYLVFGHKDTHDSVLQNGRGIGVALALAGYGLWRAINGLVALLRPQSEHCSLTDVE